MKLKDSFAPLLKPTQKRAACALMGPHPVFLDHTAPLCSLLDIPLLTQDPQVKFTYEPLYPGLRCQIKPWDLRYLAENFSTVFYPFRPIPSFAKALESFREKEPDNPLWHQKMRFIYHLHGCSDKGYHSDWISPSSHFLDVDHLLFYGKRMTDLFKDKKVLDQLKGYSVIGNYRKSFYLEHQDFFQKQIERHVFSRFEKEQPTLLYAPTWQDPENSCSLFEAYQPILDQLPSHFNLILKLHPYLSLPSDNFDPKVLYQKLHPYAEKPNIEIVPALPLVYPLLDRVVAYIGDYSSIGYDALSFSMPLFFLNHNQRSAQDKGAYLFQCGKVFKPKDFEKIYPEIEKALRAKKDPFLNLKQKTYLYAYGEDRSCEEIQKDLQKLLF